MFLHGNYIDLIIIIIMLYFVAGGFRMGFFPMLVDFLSFLFSIIVGLIGYRFFAELFRTNFSLPHSFSNVLGFLFTAMIGGAAFGYVISLFVHKIPTKFWKAKWNYFAAAIPAFGEAIIIIAFILTLAISVPLSPNIKSDISDSKIGGVILQNSSGLNAKINNVFGKAIEDSLTYLIIRPGSRETISLSVGSQELAVDGEGEVEMFNLVNEARTKKTIGILIWDENLADVARKYAKDLWERKYFGHYSPEGEDIGDRLSEAGIKYTFAGENLAMAPTVMVAHTGLMNSEGHRENILHKNYKKVGIGVIGNGIYGKMFVQVFTD